MASTSRKETNIPSINCPRCTSVFIAADASHLDCLRFIIEHWYESFRTWHNGTTWVAAEHLECLRFLIEHWDQTYMRWDSRTTRAAAYNGHLDCLRFMLEHCLLDSLCRLGWILHVVPLTWDSNTTRAAARNGQLECVKFIFEHCKDVVPWTIDLDMCISQFVPKIGTYLTSVREEWISHVSRQDNIKG